MSLSEPKLAVVFDTNAYRYLVDGKSRGESLEAVAKLKNAEAKKGITALGSVVVGTEMLVHLNNEDSENYQPCFNGLIVMGHHIHDENTNQPRIIPPPYLHLARSLFGLLPQPHEKEIKNLGGAIFDFKADPDKALAQHVAVSTFNNVANFVDKQEAEFAEDIIRLIDEALTELTQKFPKLNAKELRRKQLEFFRDGGSFEPFFAKATIIAIALSLGVTISDAEANQKAITLLNEFPLTVGFYKYICNEILSRGIDMRSKKSRKQKWNWLWDSQVSFLISPNTLNGLTPLLITSDDDLTQAISKVGYKDRVMTLSEYLNFLVHD